MRLRSLAALTLVAGTVTGCISRSAGYDDVRTLVQDRLQADVRWHAMDDERPDIGKLLDKPLTERTAAAVALLNHPSLQEAFEELGIAAGDLQTALALPNPRVQTGVHFLSGRDPQFDIEVMFTLSKLFFMSMRRGAAESELEARTLEVGGRALDLVLSVRRAFIELQTAEQVLALHRTELAAARAAWETAKQQQEVGNITDLDAVTEEAHYEEARVEIAAAELRVSLARERLGERMGLWGAKTKWSIVPGVASLPEAELDIADLERRALQESVDLRIAEHRHAAAGHRSDLATAESWLPNLGAGIEVQREEEGWEIGPEFALEVPLFNQGQGPRASAEAMMRREKSRHATVALKIRAAARMAAARLRAARGRARLYKDVLLPLKDTAFAEMQLQHNAMSHSVFELLHSKRRQLEAQRAHIEALGAYWIARAEAEQLLAGRLLHQD